MGIKLLGAGKYLPEKVVSNYDFEKIVQTSDEWIVKRTGIQKRHFSCGEYTTQMGYKAALKALESADVKAEQIDLIIVSSVSSDFLFPSISNILQGKLGACNAIAIDISCACSGFLYALDMANRYITSSDDIKTVLIICAENMTNLVDYSDRSTCVLFGDGAGAVVVQKSLNKVFSVLKTDGQYAGLIYSKIGRPRNCFTNHQELKQNRAEFCSNFFDDGVENYMFMDGRNVYKLAIEKMVEVLQLACTKANLHINDLKYLIPHQANARIIERVVQKSGIDKDKVYVNIANVGNISSACIPVCLAQLFDVGKLKSGDKIGLVSFGAGLIYGALIFTV